MKERLQRIVERERLRCTDGSEEEISLSKVGGTFLARGMQEDIDMQYGAMLEPLIDKAVEKHIKAPFRQLRWLVVRTAFDGNQTRSLVTNIFSRQPGIDKDTREFILTRTAEAAKANIFGKSAQMQDLLKTADERMTDNTYTRSYAQQ